MKKILLFLLLLYLIPYSLLAISGFGTFARPYSGSITADTVWNTSSTKIYVDGNITVSAHLTINSGLIIVFVSINANLIITGNGVITASGGSGANMIRFTADFNDNSNYGEAGERWGHISFESMTTSSFSTIDYCIIEYGQKYTGGFNTSSFGGGVYTEFTQLTISNSIIRNNYAGWGGGIFVSNASPSITKCIFSNNTSEITGGGILLYQNSASILENCIIEKNTSLGGGGGGGVFVGDLAGDVRFYNCVIASNISTTNPGNNIRIWANAISTRPSFYNTIVWGSDNSINYLGPAANPSDFNNCAIQGYTTGYTNCINLSGTNSATEGPNFVDPNNLDYSIKFVSPCRDAGTTPSHTVPNDYIGNPRIGSYDIGTYEVQYSRWKTSPTDVTSWTNAGNWEQGLYPGLTGTTGDVVIPLLSSSLVAPNIAGETIIASTKYMILEPGAKATFGTLTNSIKGTLWLKSDSHGVADSIASIIVNTYNQGGTEKIELYLTGGGNPNYKWHYVSTPVSSLPVNTFTGVTDDIAQYIESRPTFDIIEGWVAYDGYAYSTQTIIPTTFSSLTPGKGYDYYDAADQKFTFSGTLNISNVAMSLGYGGTPSLNGFNLLGNPFSSGLNWNDIVNGIYFPYPANTSKGLYFTQDNTQCTYIGGVGIPGTVTGIIPPMQGFFTKTYSTSNTITLPAAARTHNSIHARYKGATIIPLIRLKLSEAPKSDETVVRFDQQAKSYLDYDFDALKMFVSTTTTSIYSSMGGTNYAINGQPFPETFVEIPIVINLTKDTIHTISAIQLQDLDNYNVTLKDNSSGFTANLKTTPVVTFSSVKGTITDRFILKISAVTTGNEDPLVTNNTFNIYPANNFINIQTISDNWNGMQGSVKVLDLTGKTISDLQYAEFSKNSLIHVAAPMAKGIYIVEIRSGALRYVGKVIVR